MARLVAKMCRNRPMIERALTWHVYVSVLAFTGAPASFPIQKENLKLHEYLKWSPTVVETAKKFIKETLSGGAFVGIHLRNGVDWVRILFGNYFRC